MSEFTEFVVENAALARLESLGYTVKHLPAPQNDATRQAGGPEIAPGKFLSQDGNSCKKCNKSVQRQYARNAYCFEERQPFPDGK